MDDYYRIWLEKSGSLKKFPMKMFKWTPNFRVDVETSIALVWVNFPSLPIHLFSKPSLFQIGKTLGNPMRMDTAMETLAKVWREFVLKWICLKIPKSIVDWMW